MLYSNVLLFCHFPFAMMLFFLNKHNCKGWTVQGPDLCRWDWVIVQKDYVPIDCGHILCWIWNMATLDLKHRSTNELTDCKQVTSLRVQRVRFCWYFRLPLWYHQFLLNCYHQHSELHQFSVLNITDLVVKNRYFTVRLTVNPPPPFCDFLSFLTLYDDNMCFGTDFNQETSHFDPTIRIPNSPLVLLSCFKIVG